MQGDRRGLTHFHLNALSFGKMHFVTLNQVLLRILPRMTLKVDSVGSYRLRRMYNLV